MVVNLLDQLLELIEAEVSLDRFRSIAEDKALHGIFKRDSVLILCIEERFNGLNNIDGPFKVNYLFEMTAIAVVENLLWKDKQEHEDNSMGDSAHQMSPRFGINISETVTQHLVVGIQLGGIKRRKVINGNNSTCPSNTFQNHSAITKILG